MTTQPATATDAATEAMWKHQDALAQARKEYRWAKEAAWRTYERLITPAVNKYDAAPEAAYARWTAAIDAALDKEAAALAALAQLPEGSPERLDAEAAAHIEFDMARTLANDAYRRELQSAAEACHRADAMAAAIRDIALDAAARSFEKARWEADAAWLDALVEARRAERSER